MTNPIQLLEEKLQEIKDIERLCHKHNNFNDLDEVVRQKRMYIASIHTIKNTLNLKLKK